MSGGDGGTTILETPPYVIALVFFAFLVITLGFEKVEVKSPFTSPASSLGATQCCIISKTLSLSIERGELAIERNSVLSWEIWDFV